MRVRQVDNALDLFELFAGDPTPRTLTDLSEALGMPKSSTFNLIETLLSRGFIYETRHRGGYFPTRRLQDLASAIMDGDFLLQHIHTELETLAATTGETVLLSVRDGENVLYVDVVESSSPIRYHAAVGDRRPLHVTSSGKAILMSHPKAERTAILESLPPMTLHDGTARSVSDLLYDLDIAHRRGWSEDRSESTHDVMGIAVPLINGSRRFGLAVAGPLYRVRPRRTEIAKGIKATVAHIESTFADANRRP